MVCPFIPGNVSCSREHWLCLWSLLSLGGYQSAPFQIAGFLSPSAGSVSDLILFLCCLSCSVLLWFCPVLFCSVCVPLRWSVIWLAVGILGLFFPFFLSFLPLLWVSVAVCGLLLLWPSGATLSLRCSAPSCCGFSDCGAWALGTQASVVEAHRLSCPMARGLFLDQGSNMCPLRWQVAS